MAQWPENVKAAVRQQNEHYRSGNSPPVSETEELGSMFYFPGFIQREYLFGPSGEKKIVGVAIIRPGKT